MSPTAPVATDYDPLLVAAPAIRSGTTLLQRLLCSSPRALIYGETCAQDMLISMNLQAARAALFARNREGLNRTLRGVLEGDVNQFIAQLAPDVDGYVDALGRSALGWLGFCRDYASRLGRPVWGFKYPGWTPPELEMVRRFLPRARWVFVYRHVADCVRSAKAIGRLQSDQDVREFCQNWRESLLHVLGWGEAPELLLLPYADLQRRPREVLRRLADFSGARDMNESVLGHRINDVGEYVAPAELTEDEKATAEEAMQGLHALFGP